MRWVGGGEGGERKEKKNKERKITNDLTISFYQGEVNAKGEEFLSPYALY